MIAQFVTPSESCLCEKSFSKNAEQVCSPYLISLLLGGCRGIRTCVLEKGHMGVARCVRTGVVQCVGTGVVWIQAYEFTDMSVLHFCYGCTNLHVRMYICT